jgi:protein TonB
MASAQYSRKTIVGFVVIGIHVLFAIGLIAGTAVKYVPQLRDMLEAKLVKHEEEDKPKEPPPPPPDFKPPVVQAPIIDMPQVVAPPTAIQVPKEAPKVEAPKPKAEPPPIVPVRLTKNGAQKLSDTCSGYYPSASRRLSEEGSVVLAIYVGANGKVTDTKVETSSGIARLDEATQKCVMAVGSGAFETQKVGNDAVAAWFRMKYTWRLSN